ncbi:unnamed protein product [Linum tenue]|uniref:Phytosulfokine n=1 Tax=Linum tenue TaxID=586396 RepID=A0AAV0PS82_9ROSI|nr:unnamed protein product [Linum tenue]
MIFPFILQPCTSYLIRTNYLISIIIIALLLTFMLAHGADLHPTTLGDGDESLGERCEEGVGEEGEECLTRRTLQAHLDYTPPPTSPSPSQP